MAKTFRSTSYETDRIVIEVDIINLCNYHCWYCYARKRKDLWNRIMPIKDIKFIASKISKYQGRVDINLLGGEPFMHPKIKEILDIFSSLENVGEVNITTNASRIKDYDILKGDKININVSFHPSEIKDFDKFYRTLDDLYNIGKLNTVTVMMDSSDLLPKIEELMTYQEKYPKTLFEQHYPMVDNRELNISETTDKISFEKNFEVDGKLLSYDEVIRGKHNYFKGWKCKVQRYRVMINGDIVENCIVNGNIFKDYNFVDHTMVCPFEQCVEYITLNLEKYIEG